MIGELSFQYPTWYLLLCAGLGLLFAGFLYWKDNKFKEQKSWLPYLLSFLRFVGVTGIAILLLSPLIKTTKEETKKPIVVIAKDASQSMVSELDEAQQTRFNQDIEGLSASINELYDVVELNFGDEIRQGKMDTFTQQSTDISKAISYISDNYGDQNLGAVILASDGIFNEGRDPRYVNASIKAPMHTIALGDTTKRRDLLIKNVYHNKIAYLGDKFTIQADVQAFNAAGTATTLKVAKMNGKSVTNLQQDRIQINNNDFFNTKDYIIDADQVGVVRYRVQVSGISNEISSSNNYKDIYVEILDSRQKVLLLANAPHPDLTALKAIINSNKNYEVEIAYAEKGVTDIGKFNVVILHNLPSKKSNVEAILDQMNKLRIPRIFIVGSQIDGPTFNRQQELLAIKGAGKSLEDIQVNIQNNFSAYILDQDRLKKLNTYPPLTAPFGEYTAVGPINSIFNQKIKKIDTQYPMLSYLEKGGFKTGVLIGEGIWKWRLFNFMKDKNYDVVSETVNKAIQYVAVKEDKRKFRAESNKNVYKENESIIIDAQLYNDSYEMINEPDVFLKIINNEGKEYNYTLSRNNNYYSIDAGLFPPGVYRYIVSSKYGGLSLEQKGRFSVQEIQLEQYDLTARHDILQQLSEKSGGKMYYQADLGDLTLSLTETNKLKPVLYQSSKTKSLINLRWLFGILLTLLGLEWFLRRYFGYY